jgi:prefoldin alpha subunit
MTARAPSDEGSDERPQQLAAQLGLLQREMERLERRLAALEQALMEAQQAAATLQELAGGARDVEALVPLGGGVHVKARIDAGAPVLLPLGAGYSTEATAQQVAEALRSRVESLTQQYRRANEEAERVAQAAAAINERLGEAGAT